MEEKSAGVIVYRTQDEIPLFLLLYRKAKLYYKESWDFPKGGIEADETDIQAAKRETYEESGIKDLKMISKFKETIKYYYKKEEEIVKKEVIFFLAKTDQKNIRHSEEHDEARWCNYEEAMKLLTYKNSKMLLELALQYIN